MKGDRWIRVEFWVLMVGWAVAVVASVWEWW